ncbi:MAG: M48 family metalloprotease [Anaerolineales bacterium]|nr:M48 family metalloprotease [Anaerolineales bacterium]MCB9129257.1 M48 family metalloprotease [Ardenticatenales bacterium]MCB9171337.1 M48 family metalloprotease [Ardenticatenales bacterium]
MSYRTVRRAGPGGGSAGGRLVMALILAMIAIGSYMCSAQENPVTGESQRVNISPNQEIALGLQAAPELIQQFGGADSNLQAQQLVDEVGLKLLQSSPELINSPWEWEFTLLADDQTINAFALPGGQIFITRALLRLLEHEDELAGVLGHEIGHVVDRHGAQQMAKQQLTQGLSGAAVMAAYDPNNPASAQSAAVVQLIGQMVNMKYGRDDELESDDYGVKYMLNAGYNPCYLMTVMQKLGQASEGNRPPEFFSSHPNPENRIQKIGESIQRYAPGMSCNAR